MSLNTKIRRLNVKKIYYIPILLSILFAKCVLGGDTISTVHLVSDQRTTNTVTTRAINLNAYKPAGYFSIELQVAHTGTVSKVEYELSNSGMNFQEPTNAIDIVSTVTSNSGPNVDGVVLASFEPPISQYIRLKITSSGLTTNNLWLTIQ